MAVKRATAEYYDEEEEGLDEDEDSKIESFEEGHGNKRAWTSGFTGFGKRDHHTVYPVTSRAPDSIKDNPGGGEVVEVVPVELVAKRQWSQGLRGAWGKRGQKVQRVSWAKSKQRQGVRGAWGKRNIDSLVKRGPLIYMGSWGKRSALKTEPKIETLEPDVTHRKKSKVDAGRSPLYDFEKRGLNSKHIVKLINKGGKQKLRGMWGKRALMKVAGNKRAQSWLQLRGMWGKRSPTDFETDLVEELKPTEENVEYIYEDVDQIPHKTYHINSDFGKARMIPMLD